jgi:hypothetical protein
VAGNDASLGLSYADLKLLADYQSAREQTAIRAGAGGYHVTVNGNTHLKGGVITASSAPAGAVLCGSAPCAPAASELTTQTLTHERIINRDNASGQATGLTLNYSNTGGTGALAGSSFGYAQINRTGLGHTESAVGSGTLTITRPDLQADIERGLRAPQRQPLEVQLAQQQSQLQALLATPVPSGALARAVRLARVEAARSSIASLQAQIAVIDANTAGTVAGLNRSPNTSHQPLAPTFDPARATQELRAGVAITAGFGKAAYKAAGDYAERQLRDAAALRLRAGDSSTPLTAAERSALTEQANELERNWKEGGSARTLLHAVIGGLNYGAGGVVGAVANQQFQQAMDSALAGSSLSGAAKDAVRTLGSTLFATGVAGAGAGGAAFNADANNRQLHPKEVDWIKANAGRAAQRLSAVLGRPVNEQEALFWLTVAGESNVDNEMQRWAANNVRGLSTGEEALSLTTPPRHSSPKARGASPSWTSAVSPSAY